MNSHQSVGIVMIEDDEGHARLIEKNIRRAGILNDIRHFTDGTSALAYLFDDAGGPAHNGPALVLLDLNLPDMSGTDILAKIKGSDGPVRRTPVVVLTTTDDAREIQRCYDLGANVYITKPVNYENFAQAIRQLGLFLSVIQVPDIEGELMADGLRVLYIDDDDGIRRLVERALRRCGYRVSLAERGEDGVALAAAERFDVIAVDHFMPGIDGLETLQRLRALPDAPAVVYVTGSEEGRIAVAALRAGAADYVIKTVGEDFFDLLAASFEAVAARAALERAKAGAEAELRAGNARLEALLAEVNHRVANSLQLVTAILRLQHNALADPAARAALDDTQRRINAIAQVHRRLYSDNDVESVDMQEYLAALVGELRATWSTDALPRDLNVAVEPIRLATDRAVSLGVIVTELVSNACKYAYPGARGEVRVSLGVESDNRFCLAVEDDGVGFAAGAAPQGTGVGSKLIRAMAQSLRSTVEYDSAHRGTRATLCAALG